jgi:hypothetical protein
MLGQPGDLLVYRQWLRRRVRRPWDLPHAGEEDAKCMALAGPEGGVSACRANFSPLSLFVYADEYSHRIAWASSHFLG